MLCATKKSVDISCHTLVVLLYHYEFLTVQFFLLEIARLYLIIMTFIISMLWCFFLHVMFVFYLWLFKDAILICVLHLFAFFVIIMLWLWCIVGPPGKHNSTSQGVILITKFKFKLFFSDLSVHFPILRNTLSIVSFYSSISNNSSLRMQFLFPKLSSKLTIVN